MATDEESVPIRSSFDTKYASLDVGGSAAAGKSETSNSPPASDASSAASSKNNIGGRRRGTSGVLGHVLNFLRTIPAILLLATLNLMMSVPFGSTYLSPSVPIDDTTRQGMGMRLSLLSLTVGQLVFGGCGSDIDSAVPWQLGELSPFYHAFADVAVAESADLKDGESYILPTTLYLMSASTILVSLTFYVFGKMGFAEVTYFFPTYVMLGLIGGVGIWMMILTLSLSTSPSVYPGAIHALYRGPFLLTVAFTVGLRLTRKFVKKDMHVFLDPIYFLSIPMVFYGVLYLLGWSFEDAVLAGYLFKDPATLGGADESSISLPQDGGAAGGPSPWQLWEVFDPSKVIWTSIFPAFPTLIATSILAIMLTAPFIPPLALFKGHDDFDMNREFRGHGLANFISGIVTPGGLAISMSYSSSSVYTKAGGGGKLASFCLASVNFFAFIYGSHFVEYIPRCMAGALILDMGINLFLEGTADPRSQCDPVEYASIWIILVTIVVVDMTAGLVAGLTTALVTHTLQSHIEQDPVRSVRDASALSSHRWRSPRALDILDDPVSGRSKIVVFLLQGHLFFGNMGKLRKKMFAYLDKRRRKGKDTKYVVMDFTLVAGIDSSATAFIEKIRSQMRKNFGVSTTIFVSGPGIQAATPAAQTMTLAHVEANPAEIFTDEHEHDDEGDDEGTGDGFVPLKDRMYSLMKRDEYHMHDEAPKTFDGTSFSTLDEALSKCEDMIISGIAPGLEKEHTKMLPSAAGTSVEKKLVIRMLRDQCKVDDADVLADLYDALSRSVYRKNDVLWTRGEKTVSANLLLQGSVNVYADENDPTQFQTIIRSGALAGLRGLVLGEKHRLTGRCERKCIVYSLDLDKYKEIEENSPKLAQVLNLAVARTLAHELQHVSNEVYL